MTKERARQILRRVWANGASLVPSGWQELEPLAGETAFERCMGAAGIDGHDAIMALQWPERADEVERRLNAAEGVTA